MPWAVLRLMDQVATGRLLDRVGRPAKTPLEDAAGVDADSGDNARGKLVP